MLMEQGAPQLEEVTVAVEVAAVVGDRWLGMRIPINSRHKRGQGRNRYETTAHT